VEAASIEQPQRIVGHILIIMNKHKYLSVLIAIVLIFGFPLSSISKAHAERVRVYVEESSPLVDEQGNSLGIKVLQAVEEVSDLEFEFTRSTYSRALLNLKSNKADVVLHLPYEVEPGFDEYGIYLEWTVPVKADLYTLNPNNLIDISKIGNNKIGIPRGNIGFASKMTDIPQEKFYEVNTLASLVKMLAAKRVDLIWFDRVSTQQEFRNQNIHNIYYHEIPKFGKKGSIGVGLQKTKKGLRLKKKLDHLLTQIDVESILASYYKHLNPDLPPTGIMNLD
tara:strand:+ start:313 stop:1152 length:840 start_codon:yes stop_codon:yes gene_type:complete